MLLAALAAFALVTRRAALVLRCLVGFGLHLAIHLIDDACEEAWLCFGFVFDWF